jgi:hypothetical protein
MPLRASPSLLLALLLSACGGAPAPGPESRMAAAPGVPGETAAKPPPAPRQQQQHGVAARVNDEIITWKDVADSLAGVKGEVTDELRKARLRVIAEERLFLQAARQFGVTVTEQQLDDLIRREIRNYGGEEEYDRIIRLSGKTKNEWREEKRRWLMVLRLYQHLNQLSFTAPDAKTPGLLLDYVAPEEVEEFYKANAEKFKAIENVTFWRIGLQFASPKEEELKRALAESILRRLEEGADFQFLAIYYSDIRRARDFEDRGVDRERMKDYYAPETVHLLFEEMKPGETSGIVKDRNSINIFRLAQRVQQKQETLEEAQPRIRSALENQRREENRRKVKAHLIRMSYLWPPGLFDEE